LIYTYYSQYLCRKKEEKNMYKKVLVPLDGSELSRCVLNHVTDLVKEGSAGEVMLLTVVQVDTRYVEFYGQNFDIDAMRKALLDSAKESLAKIASQLNSEGIKVKTEVLEANSPAYKITEYAKESGMELIIMGTHGYTGLKKMLMGSVASVVLNSSPVPVLLIRPEACQV
jgi:nucleotide-binding universal stress UspA family protein